MSDRSAVVLVHAVIAVLAAADVWFISRFGSGIPIQDEWDLLSGWLASDSTWSWLFAHHNEHRYPLTKLLWLGGLRATGFAFKPLLYVPLAFAIGAAVMFVRASRTIRGRQHAADVLLPALLLHWGHWFNWLMAYQLGFAFVAWAAAGWFWTAARWEATGSHRWALGSIGFALAIVPCGGFGLLFTPPVAGWCLFVAWRCRGGIGVVGILAMLAAVAYTAFIALTLPARAETVRASGEFLSAAAGFLCVAIGAWPAHESVPVRVALAVMIISMDAAAIAFLVRNRTRPAAVAGGAILLGTLLIAAATAYARGTGLMDRMADVSAAGLCVAWILATARITTTRPFAALVFVAIAAAIVVVNIPEPTAYARNLRHSAYRVERDIRDGQPPLLIAGRHGHSFPVAVGDSLADTLRKLKAAGIAPYSGMPDDPPCHVQSCTMPAIVTGGEVPLPPAPANAFALRLRVVSETVNHHERLIVKCGTAEAEAWVQPHVARFSLIFPIAAPAELHRLLIGPGVVMLRIEAAEFLCRPE